MRKQFGGLICYDWTIRRSFEISEEDMKFLCEDYTDYSQEMSEEEAWWEAISSFLLNQDIDCDTVPYVIVAQVIKDCKNYFEKHCKNA